MTMVGGQEVDKYPLLMTHPNARKGKIEAYERADNYNGAAGVVQGFHGEPDVFPPMMVATSGQEESARALGYRMPGETPEKTGYAEFPKCLKHPEHRPEQVELMPVKDPQGNIIIPGRPRIEVHKPDVFVNNEREQAAWEAKGYKEPGRGDPEATLRALSGIDLDYEPEDDSGLPPGDRAASGLPAYPMWVGDRVVNSRAEHEALIGKSAMPDAVDVAKQKREDARRKLAAAQAELDAAEAELGASIEPETEAAPVEMTRSEKIKAGIAAKKAREAAS